MDEIGYEDLGREISLVRGSDHELDSSKFRMHARLVGRISENAGFGGDKFVSSSMHESSICRTRSSAFRSTLMWNRVASP